MTKSADPENGFATGIAGYHWETGRKIGIKSPIDNLLLDKREKAHIIMHNGLIQAEKPATAAQLI